MGKKAVSAKASRRARAVLEKIYRAGIEAAQPPLLLRKRLSVSQSDLRLEGINGLERLPLKGKVYVLGVGKGVDLTGPVWEELLGDKLEEGILLARDLAYEKPLRRISTLVGSHPLPDERSRTATEKCIDLLRRAGRDDWVLFFLMGGASSLLAKPAPGLTLEDKRKAAELLLKSGMDIAEMNCVRKHLSGIKAGGVLRWAYPARVLTLAISDVLGDDPAVIGSAPSFCDPTTYRDAWELLSRYRLLNKIPPRARAHLLQGLRGEGPETLKPGSGLLKLNPFVLLADNRDALAAAKEQAEALGFGATVLTSELGGDTGARAREASRFLKEVVGGKRRYRRPHCFLWGGETTVRVRGGGMGGRNQEFALVSAIELKRCPGVYLLSAGSDGSDGPTPAAGAFADGTTVERAVSLGLDPKRAVGENDSYNFFRRLGGLFSPGPTGTNVLDFKIALVY